MCSCGHVSTTRLPPNWAGLSHGSTYDCHWSGVGVKKSLRIGMFSQFLGCYYAKTSQVYNDRLWGDQFFYTHVCETSESDTLLIG